MALATPPCDLGPLGWVATPPLFWALTAGHLDGREQGMTASRRGVGTFRCGFVAGALLLLLIAPWFAGFSPAGYPVAGCYWGLLFGLMSRVAVRGMERTAPWAWPPLLAASWTVVEWLRSQGTLVFPWGTLSVTQSRALPVLQVLDLSGAFGLSFLMALGGAGAAVWLAARTRRRSPPTPGSTPSATAGTDPSPMRSYSTVRSAGAGWALASLMLTTLAVGRGVWLLATPPAERETVRVALVQMSESRAPHGAAVVCLSSLDDYLRATREAIRAGAELIFWPEVAAREDVVHDRRVNAQIAEVLREGNAHLVAGSFVDDPRTGQSSNAAALFTPDAQLLGMYAKVLIVPFGEYLPLRPLLAWTERLGMPERDLLAGKDFNPLPWSRGRIGISICFESAFGFVSRREVARGANLLAVLTSDGWVGRESAGTQHAAFAPLRAVEERRAIARAAATGISQLIDPYGRILGSLGMFRKGVLVGRLPLRRERTLYSWLGDWPVGLSWVVLLAALLPAWGTTRGARSSGPNRSRCDAAPE